jgi:hypothetical protein
MEDASRALEPYFRDFEKEMKQCIGRTFDGDRFEAILRAVCEPEARKIEAAQEAFMKFWQNHWRTLVEGYRDEDRACVAPDAPYKKRGERGCPNPLHLVHFWNYILLMAVKSKALREHVEHEDNECKASWDLEVLLLCSDLRIHLKKLSEHAYEPEVHKISFMKKLRHCLTGRKPGSSLIPDEACNFRVLLETQLKKREGALVEKEVDKFFRPPRRREDPPKFSLKHASAPRSEDRPSTTRGTSEISMEWEAGSLCEECVFMALKTSDSLDPVCPACKQDARPCRAFVRSTLGVPLLDKGNERNRLDELLEVVLGASKTFIVRKLCCPEDELELHHCVEATIKDRVDELVRTGSLERAPARVKDVAVIAKILSTWPDREWEEAVESCGPVKKGMQIGERHYAFQDLLRVVKACRYRCYNDRIFNITMQCDYQVIQDIGTAHPVAVRLADLALSTPSDSDSYHEALAKASHELRDSPFFRHAHPAWDCLRVLFRTVLWRSTLAACAGAGEQVGERDVFSRYQQAEERLEEIECDLMINKALCTYQIITDPLHLIGRRWPAFYRQLLAKLPEEEAVRESILEKLDFSLALDLLGGDTLAFSRFRASFSTIFFKRYNMCCTRNSHEVLSKDAGQSHYFLDADSKGCWKDPLAREVLRLLFVNMHAHLFQGPFTGRFRYEQIFEQLGGGLGEEEISSELNPLVIMYTHDSDPGIPKVDVQERSPLWLRVAIHRYAACVAFTPFHYLTTEARTLVC